MKILTSEFITAEFFMKGETLDASSLPHVMPSQVHGKNIIAVDAETLKEFSLPSRPEADGIFLTAPNAEASLRFADCAPVMLWNDSERWVMILHSGYKGTVLNISHEGMNLIREKSGVKSALETHAWIGPCIGREYFRKSDDEWTVKGIETFHSGNYEVDGERVYFDLAGEIRSQLLDEGLSGSNIILSGIDTLKDERCFSYRRGDIRERMTLRVRTA